MKAVMVDIETLSSESNAHILQVGAVEFDTHSDWLGRGFMRNVSDKDQGRHIDPSTVRWWTKQLKYPDESYLELRSVLLEFTDFCKDTNAEECWAHGSSFDHSVLDNARKQLGLPVFMHYKTWRDTRTLFALCKEFEWPNNDDKHDALADAIAQAQAVQRAIQGGMR